MLINKKEKNYYFGINKRAVLTFRKGDSNYFFTLLDLRGKVVCCKTSGSSNLLRNKRKKISFQSVETIINLFEPIFNFYNINKLYIEFKNLPSALYYILVNNLELKGITILGVKMIFKSAHNGMRNRKVRRV